MSDAFDDWLADIGISEDNAAIKHIQLVDAMPDYSFTLPRNAKQKLYPGYLVKVFNTHVGTYAAVAVSTEALFEHKERFNADYFDWQTKDCTYWVQSLMAVDTPVWLFGEAKKQIVKHDNPHYQQTPQDGMVRCFDCNNRACRHSGQGRRLNASMLWRWCNFFK